jgi:hypothetical protein
MTAQTVIGIDPVENGAGSVFGETRDLLEIVDLPATPEANGGSATHVPLLADPLGAALALVDGSVP